MFAIAICWWPLHLRSPHFHGNCKEACLGFLCLTGLTRSFRSELWTSWKAESGVLEAPGLSQRTAPTSPSRDPRGRMRRAVQLHPSRTLRWGGRVCRMIFFRQQSIPGTSLVVQWLGFHPPLQGVRFQSLVGKPESHMPRGQGTKPQNRGNVVTNSTKTLKMVHIKKKILKKRHPRGIKIFSTLRGQCGTKLEGGWER